jgi:hypothetical protein
MPLTQEQREELAAERESFIKAMATLQENVLFWLDNVSAHNDPDQPKELRHAERRALILKAMQEIGGSGEVLQMIHLWKELSEMVDQVYKVIATEVLTSMLKEN